jgi:protein-S-isoprenylcysteine O-methyltransferase Ste14
MKSVPIAIGRNSSELITEGIFKITRNPQSLSRNIGLLGVAMWGRSFFALFLAVTWIIINHINILIEEKHLESLFGVSYLEYCSSTPRYFKIIRTNGMYIISSKEKRRT